MPKKARVGDDDVDPQELSPVYILGWELQEGVGFNDTSRPTLGAVGRG
jgi:hypothetical protein